MDAILESRGKQGLLLSVVALALFVDGLDGTIVNVVIPEIGGFFGVDTGTTLYAGLFGFGSGSSGTAIDELSSGVFLDGFVFCMYVGIALMAVSTFLAVVVNEKKPQADADG